MGSHLVCNILNQKGSRSISEVKRCWVYLDLKRPYNLEHIAFCQLSNPQYTLPSRIQILHSMFPCPNCLPSLVDHIHEKLEESIVMFWENHEVAWLCEYTFRNHCCQYYDGQIKQLIAFCVTILCQMPPEGINVLCWRGEVYLKVSVLRIYRSILFGISYTWPWNVRGEVLAYEDTLS